LEIDAKTVQDIVEALKQRDDVLSYRAAVLIEALYKAVEGIEIEEALRRR